ncbi:MAG: hypothetical protein IKX15_02910, partial [Spirochaetales bacterium]|nr:hypothetical protein [Spirochaetales bacterium]
YFNVVDGKLVYGFAGIKGLGPSSVQMILAERAAHGPYKDFMDFIKRSDSKILSTNVLEGLINSGAFDSFGFNRPTLLANYEMAIKFNKEDKDAQSMGQNLLFAGFEEEVNKFDMKIQPDFDFLEKLEIEKTYLGFYVSGHPLDTYKTLWENCVKLDLSKPERITEGIRYDFVGMVTERKEVMTKTGSKMGRLVIEDYNGHLEVTVFAKQWAMCSLGISTGKIIAVSGKYRLYNGNMGFSADVVFVDPNQLRSEKPHRVYVEIDHSIYNGRDALREIREVVRRHRGTAEFVLAVYKGTDDNGKLEGKPQKIVAGPKFTVDGSKTLMKELRECQSVHDVYCE